MGSWTDVREFQCGGARGGRPNAEDLRTSRDLGASTAPTSTHREQLMLDIGAISRRAPAFSTASQIGARNSCNSPKGRATEVLLEWRLP